ncbi:MAG: hypothetical protein JST_000371 [Candidatus Parcubacteria bacterium]|nr:MAG: hypothetical protein JST_3420 [Candidatus Parcubacteria bacterium]
MNKLRKIFTASVMVMTLAVMLGFGSFAHAATPQAGDLIKMDGLSTVYFLGKDSKRYVYPHESVFFSWHRDFSGVVTVSASELQSYPLGANVTMRPGTKLVKITTDPSVYAVEPNGVLRKIQSESDAIATYGPNWAKRVVDVADSFFTNYTIGQPLASGEIAAGTLVKKSDDATVYYFDGTNYRAVASESAFYANRFSFNDVITLSKEITPKANAISNNEFAYDAQNATGPVTTASGVTVSLSSATPAAASLVGGQALAPLVSVNLTAANDGAVTLKSIKFKKTGFASDSTIAEAYLYDGNTRLTDVSSMSNGYINFSGASLVTIPAGQTKTLTVKANIDGAAQSGNIGLSLAAATDVVSTGATVNGSFPITGNTMSLFKAPTDMSVVTLTKGSMPTTEIKAGSMNAVIWDAKVKVTQKPVDFKYLALQQVGSIQKDDLANFAIYVDGVKAGDGTFVDNKLVFDLSKAYRMNTGDHFIEVKADIVKGSSRTFSFQMQTKVNVVFTDTNYNINVTPVATITDMNMASREISSGSLSVSLDSTYSATEVVKTASNATLVRYTMKAWGEDVKINTLKANVLLTGKTGIASEGINDVAIYVDGTQVGSSQSYATTSNVVNKDFDFGSSNLFTIEAGKQVTVEVRGSLNLDSDTTVKSVTAEIEDGSAEGVTSFNSVTVTVSGNKTLNITSGNVKVAMNSALQNMNVSKNSQKVKIGSYILSAGSAEGVVISNIKVGLATTSDVFMDNISNLYISENETPVQPQTTNDFNVNLAIAANGNKIVDVYADLNELDNDDEFNTTMSVTYRTDKTNNSGITTSVNGQTMTVKTGSLGTPSLASTPNSFFVLGGSTATAANYKFVANNADAYINELSFASVTDGISQIIVNGVSVPVIASSTNVASSTATVSGLNIRIPAGLQGANIEVKAVYNNVTSAGQGGVSTGADQNFELAGYKYTVNGTQHDESLATGIASKEMRLVASYPAVVDASNYTDTTLKIGDKTEVMRFTVTAAGNSLVNLKTVVFKLSSNYTSFATGSSLQIVDATDLGTVLGTTTLATSTNMAVTFNDVVTIDKGAAKTFVVYANTATGIPTTGTAYFGLSLVNTGWAWNDGTILNTDTQIDGTHIAELTGTTFTLAQ